MGHTWDFLKFASILPRALSEPDVCINIHDAGEMLS